MSIQRTRALVLGLLVVIVVSCGRDASVTEAPAPAAAAPASAAAPAPSAASPAAPAAAEAAPAIPSPCWLPGSDVSSALGAAYAEGFELPAIPGVPTRSCKYESTAASQLRINVRAHSAAMAAAIRADLAHGLAGVTTVVTGDTDGAVLQQQQDLGTCALHFVRGNAQYELRLMTCREAGEAEKLARLARP